VDIHGGILSLGKLMDDVLGFSLSLTMRRKLVRTRRRCNSARSRISELMAISFHDSSPCGFNLWCLNQFSGAFICATIISIPR